MLLKFLLSFFRDINKYGKIGARIVTLCVYCITCFEIRRTENEACSSPRLYSDTVVGFVYYQMG